MAYTSFVIATNPPVAFYRLEEAIGINANDSSENDRDATYVGTPTLQQTSAIYEPGTYSVLFNGSSQHITLGTQIDTAITNDFSLSLYAKFTALPVDTETFTLIDCHDRFELLALKSGSNEGIYIYLPSVHTLVTDGPFIPLASLNTTDFFNVAVIYDQVTLKIFLNGELIDSEAQTAALQAAGGNGTFIAVDNTGAANYFGGLLDEIGFFNNAIIDRSIALNYFALGGEKYYRAAVLSMFPNVYLMLDEVAGSTADDKTDNGFDGTYVGSPTLDSDGKFGSGIAFDPATFDYIDMGLPLGAGSGGDKTFVFYVNPDNFTNSQYLIANKNVSSGGISIILNTDATIGISWGYGENIVQTVDTIVNTEFTLITVTMNSTDNVGKIYFNQDLKASGDLSAEQTSNNKIRASGQWLTVGSSGSDSLFDGNLDEISIWDTVLSIDEVAYLYFYGFVEYPFYDFLVLSKSPLAFWNFQESSGNIIDQSPNGQDLTLVNFTSFSYRQPALTIASEDNYAVYFNNDPLNGYFAVPSKLLPMGAGAGNDWTFESWLKFGNLGNYWEGPIFRNGGNSNYFSLRIYNHRLRLSQPGDYEFSYIFNNYQVYHIVVKRYWTGTAARRALYVNGVLEQDSTYVSDVTDTTANLRLFHEAENWRLDYCAFYDRPLTDFEVGTHYNAGKYGFGYNAQARGTVYDDTGSGNPIGSKIRISAAITGEFVKDEQNNPTTGKFEIDFDNFNEVYLQSIPTDTTRRSKIHGPLKPEVI